MPNPKPEILINWDAASLMNGASSEFRKQLRELAIAHAMKHGRMHVEMQDVRAVIKKAIEDLVSKECQGEVNDRFRGFFSTAY